VVPFGLTRVFKPAWWLGEQATSRTPSSRARP
jgi:hypothetical protein